MEQCAVGGGSVSAASAPAGRISVEQVRTGLDTPTV